MRACDSQGAGARAVEEHVSGGIGNLQPYPFAQCVGFVRRICPLQKSGHEGIIQADATSDPWSRIQVHLGVLADVVRVAAGLEGGG